MKDNLKIIGVFLLLLGLFFYLLPPRIASAAEVQPTAPAGYRLIRIEQWQDLKKKSNLLAAKLQLAQNMLTQLEAPSGELMNLLAEARAQLLLSQQELKECKVSLESAKSSIVKSEKLYSVLTKQLDQERRQAAKDREAAYRKGWLNGFCVGVASTVLLTLSSK